MSRSVEERFAAKHGPDGSGCDVWTGATSTAGYGYFWDGESYQGAHRYSWKVSVGPIPDGLWVLHHCDNPPCVRVEHLFLGTNTDNQRDLAAKGLHAHQRWTHCKHGHLFDAANTRITVRGHRQCRKCAVNATREKRIRRRQRVGTA